MVVIAEQASGSLRRSSPYHRGDYQPGDALPSESQLRTTYDVFEVVDSVFPSDRHAFIDEFDLPA